ncbi:hypothetical protein PISMIDRAFT_420596 [Pisolithus microcarpus 441]|uniref:Unplaced genomic scaffold scaffold_359, whole genome shotgun sequence n=1 Tax=Pisolithus microcarpus 441 TaxID=765257 RepID=A0A0C9YFX1_9AGAM|nr:hypothetical protein PISMIDRAFT_420596 [Pisolithus microcarpus 441]
MTKLRGWMLSDDSRRIDEDCERLICDYIFVMDLATGEDPIFDSTSSLSTVHVDSQVSSSFLRVPQICHLWTILLTSRA